MLVLIPIPSRGSKVVIFFIFLISTKRDPRLYGIMWIHWIARDFYRRLGIGIFFFFFVFCVGGAKMVFQVISVKKIWKSKGGTCPPSPPLPPPLIHIHIHIHIQCRSQSRSRGATLGPKVLSQALPIYIFF